MNHLNNCNTSMDFQQISEKLECLTDERGILCVAQPNNFRLPFQINRVFWIYGVPEGAVRGEHANRCCTELLVAVAGSVKVVLTNGTSSCEVTLDNPTQGLYIPPMVWCRLSDFTKDCVCVCLADQEYDVEQYINDYSTFIKEVNGESNSLSTSI